LVFKFWKYFFAEVLFLVLESEMPSSSTVEAEIGGFFVGSLLLVVLLVGSLVDGLLVELDAVILLVVLCVGNFVGFACLFCLLVLLVGLLEGSLVDGLLVELFEIEVGLD
jgi:hypothetical protein